MKRDRVTKRKTDLAALAISLMPTIFVACAWAFIFSARAPAVAATSRPPIRIGVLVDKSGPVAQNGIDVEHGIRLYFEDEVKEEIAGRKIELIVEDGETDAAKGLTKARALIERRKVQILLGPNFTATAIALRDFVDAQKIPQVLTYAAARILTQEKASPYIFRVSYTDAQNFLPMGEYFVNKLRYRKAIVVAPDYVAGRDMAASFMDSFTKAGGQTVGEVYIPLNAMDVAPYLTKMQSQMQKADVVYAILWGGIAPRFIKGYVEYGFKAIKPLFSYGGTNDTYLSAIGDAALGIPSNNYWAATLDTPANRRFIGMMKAKYGKHDGVPINDGDEQGYVAAELVGEALKAVNGDVENLPRFLQTLRKTRFEAPRGPFRLDDQQNTIFDLHIFRVEKRDGQLTNVPVGDVIRDVDQFWKPKR